MLSFIGLRFYFEVADVQEIDCQELIDLVTGRCGLVVGPGLTLDSGEFISLQRSVVAEFGCAEDQGFFDNIESAIQSRSEDEVREWFRLQVQNSTPPRLLSHIAQAKWSTILSTSIDLNLETRIEVESSKRPTRRDVSVVTDLFQQAQPRAVPCLKLLGSISSKDFVLTHTDYLTRKAQWRHAISRFADTVKGHPVLCVGVGEDAMVLNDLATEFLGASGRISRLILLADDPVLQNHVALRPLCQHA